MGRYTNIRQKRNPQGTRYYRTNVYPDIPRFMSDTYVISQSGDRYDRLALQYYSDPSLWWIIASANPQYIDGGCNIPEGVQIRIPGDPNWVISDYNRANQ